MYNITEEQIKETHKWLKAEFKEPFEFLFPECFKSKLEVGKWYKHFDHEFKQFLFCFNQFGDKNYGFNKVGNWSNELNVYEKYSEKYTPATESEVFEMLKKEAEKRGFADKNGVNFIGVEKNCYGTINHTLKTEILFDSDKNGGLYASKGWIFKNGKWATIVETPKEISIAEAKEIVEKQLGHKVKIVS